MNIQEESEISESRDHLRSLLPLKGQVGPSVRERDRAPTHGFPVFQQAFQQTFLELFGKTRKFRIPWVFGPLIFGFGLHAEHPSSHTSLLRKFHWIER